MHEFGRMGFLLAPLLAGALFHGLCMQRNWLRGLARPIDGGHRFRGRPLFGPNKTWRGVAALGIGTGLGFALAATGVARFPALGAWTLMDYRLPDVAIVGVLLGAVGMLAELPNSFAKRQLGIGPGTAGRGGLGLAFFVVDQIDILLGIWLVLACWIEVNPARVLYSAAWLLLVHPLATVVGYLLGMRTTAR